jgi:hypothetical protein
LSYGLPRQLIEPARPCVASKSRYTSDADWADSSGRRNVVVMPMAEEPVESFSWSFPTKGLAWSCVDRVSDAIKLITRVSAEVCAFREVLSKQAIGVLVCAALPRTLRIAEVDLQPGIEL